MCVVEGYKQAAIEQGRMEFSLTGKVYAITNSHLLTFQNQNQGRFEINIYRGKGRVI